MACSGEEGWVGGGEVGLYLTHCSKIDEDEMSIAIAANNIIWLDIAVNNVLAVDKFNKG